MKIYALKDLTLSKQKSTVQDIILRYNINNPKKTNRENEA